MYIHKLLLPICNGRKVPMSSPLTLWSLSAIDVPYSCICVHMYRYVQYVCVVLLPSCMVHCHLFPPLHVCCCNVGDTVSSTPFYLTVALSPIAGGRLPNSPSGEGEEEEDLREDPPPEAALTSDRYVVRASGWWVRSKAALTVVSTPLC